MKAAVFYGKHDVRVEEVATPKPGPGEVLIRVMACGVCGTDVHIFEGDKGAAECTPPTILGHEFAGVVEETGEGVLAFKKGDRVCIDPNAYCGNCGPCHEGIVHYCENMIGYGTTVNGGFAQYCAVSEKQVYRLGDRTSFEQGAMTEPVACCLHGIDLCGISQGSCVAVIGGGMIGQIMLQLAKVSGASTVILLEPVEGKRETAKQLGADLCIDPVGEDVKAVLKSHGVGRIQTVIECVGRVNTIRQAIDLAGNKSVVMMFGLTKPEETVEIRPFEIFQKEIELKASYINPLTQQRALNLIDAGRLDVSSMVAQECGLEMLPEILASPELRRKGKYIINPWK